ncbi:MAG: hypothetical protein RLZZ87_151 [Actinomycetota bacterium]|jgi:hypothetical protein
MRKASLFFSVVIALGLLQPLNAHADGSTSGWSTIPEAGTSVGVLGATFAEDLADTTDGASFVRKGDDEVCTSVADASCSGGYAQILLPPCEIDDSSLCVIGLKLGQGKSFSEGKLIRNVGTNVVKGDPSRSIPNGYNSSLWEVANQEHSGKTNTYAVYVQYRVRLSGELLSFRASVTPYVEVKNERVKELEFSEVLLPSGSKRIEGNNSAHGCAWTENGLCGLPANFAEYSEVTLDLKINHQVVGFLNGRLKNPLISLENLSTGFKKLSITGQPVPVQKSFARTFVADATPEIIQEFNFEGFSKIGQTLRTYVATDINALDHFDKWSRYFPDEAQSLRTYWGFSSSASSSDKCLQSNERILGLVTTNAMVYEPRPPRFIEGSLNYRVASLHSKPNGGEFQGSYDLILDSKAARCLYGYSDAPISASVSITSGSGEQQNISVTTVNERDGWFHLGAYGFTFSSPVIRVKLAQPNPRGVSKEPPAGKTVIICLKGKLQKKVSAAKPTCPKGYKKVAR